MNFSYSLPNRVNGFQSRLLVSLVLLSFVLLAFTHFVAAHTALPAVSSQGNPLQVLKPAAPQAVPVPTPPSVVRAQAPAPKVSATPATAGYRPLPQPVATPPAGR